MAQARLVDSRSLGSNSRTEQRDDAVVIVEELAGDKDDISTAEATSREEWLIYNGEYQALICAFHGYAVQNLEGHLRDRHPDIGHRARSDLVRRHKDLRLQAPTKDQLVSYGVLNPAPAVKGLTVHRGFACIRPGCGHLTPSWKCLRVHFNEAYNVKGAKARADLWTSVYLQTFFTGPKKAICYFCVSVSTGANDDASATGNPITPIVRGRRRAIIADRQQTQSEDQEIITDITRGWSLQQEEQEKMQKVMEEGILRHETTNWLKRTGWSAHFAGRNLADIQALSRMPGRDDDELRRMTAALDRLFFDRCIDGLKNMPLMTRLLLASPPSPRCAQSTVWTATGED
ncbi:hypothetical protein IWW34DRAFT_735572 [Fusarium oxysporum f. sp. albedinis]|nr:hypothetical protein IWW34DRAFT_735572 [Fusarium oxysporum f. sp. albedinis]KAJ0127716.1 Uncharacterized protein HZ326_29181 [Fusarium oxysporum f. sp. albedinis]KAK2468544.1 hypothetical protein H9L39_20190 [Fusarium oxysporum f. sp. albedinis]